MSRRLVACMLNGRSELLEVEDRTTLLDALRERGLTGAKLSCDMEVCGTCTVLIDGLPYSGCTTLAAEAEGGDVQTIEGCAEGDLLSRVQRAFIDHFAFQCGFCTPGMILAAESLLRDNPKPNRAQVIDAMDGNICRCTGYSSIVEAVLSVGGHSTSQ